MIYDVEIQKSADVEAVVDHILVDKQQPENITEDFKWLLLFHDDGVVWGYHSNHKWEFSSDHYPDFSPNPTCKGIQEMRIFGPDSEMLIWRRNNMLVGRIAKDKISDSTDIWLRYHDIELILMGSNVLDISEDKFVLITNNRGAYQAIPYLKGMTKGLLREERPRLQLRQYFTLNDNTGEISVGFTRMKDIAMRG